MNQLKILFFYGISKTKNVRINITGFTEDEIASYLSYNFETKDGSKCQDSYYRFQFVNRENFNKKTHPIRRERDYYAIKKLYDGFGKLNFGGREIIYCLKFEGNHHIKIQYEFNEYSQSTALMLKLSLIFVVIISCYDANYHSYFKFFGMLLFILSSLISNIKQRFDYYRIEMEFNTFMFLFSVKKNKQNL